MQKPKWLRGIEQDPDVMPELPMPPPPTIAAIPRPAPIDERDTLHTATLISKGAVLLMEQIRNERERHAKLGGDAIEAVSRSEGDRKKIALLELENAELLNKVQVLAAENHEKTRILQDLRGALEGLGVQRREPIPRKRNHKKEPEPCNEPSPLLPSSLSVEALPQPASLLTATSDPTNAPTGPTASSTEKDAGIEGTA